MIPSPGIHLFGLAASAIRDGGGSPAPTPTPSPAPLKVIFDGDSISAANGSVVSMANQWIAANPATASANLAVSSARIRGNGGNSLDDRRPAVMAAASGFSPVLCVLIGANDLYDAADAAAWQTSLLQYLAAVRADVPGIKIGVGTVLPMDEAVETARAGHNARRATVNPFLRGQVGSTIDFLIPYGEHPEFTDAAAATAVFSDGLHPSQGGASFMLETLNAVLNPIVAGATGAVPSAFTFADNATATASTVFTERNIVTGMGMGQSATATMSGSGEFARGTLPAGLAYGTGAQTIVNGDILTSRLTSSATNAATVQHTLAMGAASDAWDIITAANTATTVFSDTYRRSGTTLQSERQCYGAAAINAPSPVFANAGRSTGKHYLEFTFYTPPVGGGAGVYQVAVGGPSNSLSSMPGGTNTVPGATYRSAGTVRHLNGTTTTTLSGYPTYGIADAIGVCIDADNDKVWFLKNGVSIGGDPAAGTGGFPLNPVATASWWPAAVPQREDGHWLNCGQDPFNYAPPQGFVPYG